MSRFGDTATIKWNSGDTFGATASTTFSLTSAEMNQYPMEQGRVTDEKQYRSKTGQAYSWRNYILSSYDFTWTNIPEAKRLEIAQMADSLPIFSYSSGGNDLGTFRIKPNSFKDKEVAFELYDVSFKAEESS